VAGNGECTSNSMFIATAVDKVSEELSERHDGDHVHKWFRETNRSHHRILGIEDFVLRIEHSYDAPKFHAMSKSSKGESDYAHSQRSIVGSLKFKDGREDLIFSQKKPDIISIRALLEAANVTLDSPSDRIVQKKLGMQSPFPLEPNPDTTNPIDGAAKALVPARVPAHMYNTMRDRGVSLVITLTYDNSKDSWFGVTVPKYVYDVHRISETEYETVQSVSPSTHHTSLDVDELHSGSYGHGERILHHKYGIHITIIQTGRLGRFSFSALLGQLGSGMGLLALGATVVEYLAIYAMPKRRLYREAMIEMLTTTDVVPDKMHRH